MEVELKQFHSTFKLSNNKEKNTDRSMSAGRNIYAKCVPISVKTLKITSLPITDSGWK